MFNHSPREPYKPPVQARKLKMENFHKYTKIHVAGHEDNKELLSHPEATVVVEEKIDRSNIRFMIKGGKVIFGSRTQQLTSDEGDDSNVEKGFRSCLEYVRNQINEAVNEGAVLSDFEGFVFYGEGGRNHAINYDLDEISPFIGFDVYKIKEGCYVDYKEAMKLFNALYLPFVPVIKECKVKDIVWDESIVPESAYASPSSEDKRAEGVVIKKYGEPTIFTKIVREAFKEKQKLKKPRSEDYGKDEEFLVEKYCTSARVEKMIFKLVDEGFKLEMTMMKELAKRVYLDLWEEEWNELCLSQFKVNFKLFRGMVGKKCVKVLKQMMINNARGEGVGV